MKPETRMLGKWRGTYGVNNRVWFKRFENGAKIRVKKQGEITLHLYEVWDMLRYFRKIPKTNEGFSTILIYADLIPLWQKYPEIKDFLERLFQDKVTDKEKEEIRNAYETKLKILKNLEDKKQ